MKHRQEEYWKPRFHAPPLRSHPDPPPTIQCSWYPYEGQCPYLRLALVCWRSNGECTFTDTVRANGYKTASSKIDIGPDSSKISVELEAFVAVKDIALSLSQVMKTKEYALSDYLTITPETATRKDVTWSAAETLPAGVTLADGKLTVTADAQENAVVKLTAKITNGALADGGKTETDYSKAFTLTVTKYLATITFTHGSGDHPDIKLPAKKTVNEDTTLAAPADPTDDNGESEASIWLSNAYGRDHSERAGS